MVVLGLINKAKRNGLIHCNAGKLKQMAVFNLLLFIPILYEVGVILFAKRISDSFLNRPHQTFSVRQEIWIALMILYVIWLACMVFISSWWVYLIVIGLMTIQTKNINLKRLYAFWRLFIVVGMVIIELV